MAERVDGPGTTRGNRKDDELSQANDFRLSDEEVDRHDVVMHEPGHMEKPLDPESSAVFTNEDEAVAAASTETADSSQNGLPPLEDATSVTEEFAPSRTNEVGTSSRPTQEEETAPEPFNTVTAPVGDDTSPAEQPTRFTGERSERGEDSPPPAAPAPQAATSSDSDPVPVDTTDPTPAPTNLAATVSLQNIVAGLSETTDTSSSVKVADIVITDDGIGTNTLSLAGADAAKFEIVDTGSGFELHLRAGTVLDHETDAAFDITVQVDDPTVGGTPDDSVSQTVNIGDVNDTGQVFVSGNSDNAAENINDAAVIYTASVTDADTTGEAITFSLVDDAGGLFEIDANTGQVTLAGGQSLDFETATSHDITIRSTDGTNSTDHTVTINVTDVNDNAQVFTSGAGASVAEDVNDSSVIYTATTTDVDTTGEAITYSLTDDAGGLFEINSATGEVTLAGGQALDFETATSHDITIRSSDGTNTTDQTVTVNVTNVNEGGVSAIADTDASANGVAENGAPGSVVGITALATDPDSGDTVTYSLSNDAGGLFAIDANTGVVTIVGSWDAEVSQNHTIEVTASSSDGSSAVQTFNVTIEDVDEFNITATTDTDGAANTVAESAAVGTAVGVTALATDADVTDTVTYSLSSNPGGFFAIDANTGVVTVANALDYETDTSHTIEVTSTSTDGSTSTQTFTINVSDVDEADVGAISDTDGAGNAVNENATVGTVVGVTAFASDADGTDTVSYSLSDDAGGLFAIDPNTGVVTVAGAIDRETAASYDIEVTATSDDGSTSTQTFTISVNDLDEFDVSTPTDTNAGANTVSETAANGTAVGITASASDGDATNSAVTYSIVDGSGDPVVGGPFTVDPNTGVVTIADNTQLDYETATSHTINVKATSADGSEATQSFTVNLTDTDEADVGAISDTNGTGNAVNENASVGTVVGVTAFASDADGTDTVSYSLSDDAGGLFAIDANTGVVTVAGAIDRETAASYNIEVTATSTDGSTSTQTFTINVNDLDEFDVSTPTDSNAAANSVAENAANGTAVGITATAADGDATNSTVTYSLVDGSGDPIVGGPFAVDPNTGVVTVADNSQLDYETATSHTIYVKATSADGSDATQTFTVNLTDVNEAGVGAISDTNANADGVAENSAVGTVVGVTALASDPDVTDTVTYSLSDNAGGLFAIDANTGVVTVAGALDAETAQNHSIEVTATSTDGSTSTQTFNIAVNDVDEFNISATSDNDGTANSVSEAATVGTTVGITALASDADVTDTVTYSLSSNPGGFFAIDANTGVVTVANALDYETGTSHVIEVKSTSDDGSTSTQTFTVNVTDHDEADVGAISDTNAGGNAVNENASVGTVVGVTAFASDTDGTDTVSYSLSDDAGGLFAIDPNTGVVTVAGAIDRETAASYDIEVTATSTDGSTSTQTFTIGVNDLDEFDVSAPTDSNAAANSVAENAANGTAVGITATAADGDATNSAVTYSVVDGSGDPVVGGPFTVDPNTGVVTIADNTQLDYETATSHTVYIKATSADGSDATQSFTINLTDTDEGGVGAVSDSNVAGNAVNEDASVGTVVGITAVATDPDGTDTVTYSLSDDAGGLFTIDANTGVVTVAAGLDAETAQNQSIEVTATSTDGSTSTQTFNIGVNDVDEFDISATSDNDGTANTVSEAATVGTAVGVTALATDADVTDTVTYSLSSNPGGFFAIDANTGVVTVANALDYETDTSHTIEVTSTSDDGSTSTQTFTINVSDHDEADVGAISDTNATTNAVDENSSVGAVVGITAFASDADGTDTVTYSLSDNAGGLFAIDANTGVVTVAGAIDRETAASYDIEVTATSTDGSTSTQSFTVNVNDLDEADVGSISDTNASGNAVNEDASVGTVVGITALASDPDSTDTVTYSLSDDAGGLFTIDANTGVVTVAAGLDAETAQNHSIEVTATSTDGSTSTQTFNIGVNDVDEFDISATSDNDGTANSVSESATVGTAVGVTALATDADVTDTVSYSLSSNPGGFFAIDANTGVVTVAGALDYETDTSHVIEVTSTSDDGSTSTQTFTINVSDEDEADVGAISDTNAAGNAVDENSSVGTVVGVTAFASDADGTDSVTYSLSDDAGGLFAIDANTGVVTVAGAIDRETAASYNIEVTATSDDGSTSTQTFTVNVNDLDEFDVSTPNDSNVAANSVSESAANGTAVGITASASDGDATNNTVTYSLVDGSGDPIVGGPFTVDANTGVVTVADNTQLDYETATSHTIYVKATSADGSDATQSFTVNLTDADEADVGAISDTNAAGNAVNEDASVGTVVGITALAADPDGTDTVTYSLSDDAGGLFTIDANTGVVTVAAGLDAETAQNHSIEVTATSTDGSTSTQTFNIGVNDIDEFDISATSDNDGTANAVSESATVGTAVGVTALATDADVTDTVSYSLSSNPGGFFAIDANTGVVTVAGALDYETDTSHVIEVTSTSADGSTSTQTFTINVSDEDEADVGAISDTNVAGNAVDENSSVGTVVGVTAFASDADGTDDVTYSLSDDAGGLFAIDANTGVVTVAGAIDRETAASYNIEVTATSDDGSTSTQTFTVNVNDLDEFDVSTPTDSNVAANSVSESAANGTAVGITASASDGDATNSSVTYSLVDGSGDPIVGGPFAVDANTGVVTVADNTQLDHETATSHTIYVKATSADGSDATQSFTVNLTDEDEADVGAISDTNVAGNAVNEDATVGTVVGITALADDPDSTDTVTYSLSDDAGGLFTIDANTGVVTVAAGLDAETAQNHSIEVTATSTDGSTSTQTFNIGVNDVDEFDISATSDNDGTANSVSESATVGTAVGVTALATDADVTDTVSYSLSSNPGGFFAIDANTGVVTVAGALDYETDTSHVIEVTSTSADGSTSTQTFTINVSDEDEADVGAISDTNAAGNAVDENSSVGTVVGVTAFASDADGTDDVTYSLSDDAGGLFAIDANTGVVTVAGAIDRETAASYDIEVTATSDDGSTSTQTFTVNVNDLDEFDVSTPTDSNAAANSVSESAANGTAVGITAAASDGDATNSTVTYSLVDGSGDPIVGGPFAVDANTGVVTVADNSQLDYETATSHTIYVKATSADGSDATQSFTVNLTDVDEADVGAISDTNATANAVDENSSVGTVVGITAQASDADGTDTVTYSLSDNAGGLFAIDANTGVVTVAGAIDAETAQNHSIEVTATSTDGSTSTQTFNIAVNDVDEFNISATTDNDGTANSVSEAATVGTAVGVTALASDADVTDTVSYSLSSNPGGFFAIDANTGVVTVAGALDFETNTSHVIEVTSTSDDGSTSTETFTINVADFDEADVGAISDTNASANAVDENVAVGTTVGITASATDADGSDDVTYSLSDNAGGLFDIDANTGVVTVAGAIDREAAASYNIEVTATSDDGSTSTQTYTINVNDIDEFDVSTPTDSNASANTVAEDASVGTVVGVTASAADGDATTNGVTYSLSDDAGGLFTIDANTGVVTVAGSLDYETATSHTIEVTATSQDGSTSTETFTIGVENVFDVAPTDITFTGGTVNETVTDGGTIDSAYDPSGSTVATLNTTDSESGDSFSYAITSDPSGHFEIVGNEVRVKAGQTIDYETDTSHDITIEVTDAGGNTYSETITINVQDYEGSYTSATTHEVFDGTSEEDTLTGGSGTNHIDGGAGDDYIDGGDGSDQIEGGAGADTLIGGSGTDTVMYWQNSSGITIDLENQTVTGGEATGDTISGFERVTASAHDDIITGSSGDNTIYAQQGDDTITGGGGDDYISGASGTDTVIYTGNWSDYTITKSGNNYTVVDNRPGSPDGTDTVSYVEFFQFADGTVAEADVLNDAPTDISHTGGSIDENSAAGATVATLSSTDADSGIASETATYSITNDPSGNFEIVGNEVRVKSGASIDFETDATHDITVEVTDVHGATYSEVITVNVNDINEAPTDIEFDLNTGISLNTDGGNNAYLYASNGGDIVGGLSEMTIEVEFASSHAAGTDMPLFSYHVGGASDEIELGINDTGSSMELYIEIGEQAVSVPGYDAQQLLDGSDHQVSLTWDNTAGDWEIFVDGTSVASGTGIATGHTIATGGAIVLGQEQDSLNGGYDNTQIFDGTYYDVRIFDDVRTSTEIANNAFEEVSSSEPGLVANWQMNDLSGGMTTDTVSGNNLTVTNVTGTGWTTSTPSLTSTIFEDNAAGTVAAVLSTTDPDSGDTFSYAITNDPSGNFEIVGNEIRVKAGANLDHETNASHDITVQVTDSGGLTYQETVTINVADVNEAPTDITFTGNEDVAIGAAIGTTVATAASVDQDAGETFTYALTDDAGGAFTIDSATGAIKIASGGDSLELTQLTGSANPFNGIDVGLDSQPALVDLDGDGDLDLLVGNGGSYGGDSEYYENTGTATNPTFAAAVHNPFGLIDIGNESSPSFVDIDGDGDLDLFIGESDGTINYFENTGNSTSPSFTQRTGASNPLNLHDVGLDAVPTFVDIDNDGDMDAVVGGDNGLLDFFINNGTAAAPSFTEVSDATFGISGIIDVGSDASPVFVDADGDGDMDMFVGEYDGTLNYFENTGTAENASFSNTPTTNPFGIVDIGSESSPTFVDVDGDGDMDLVVGESDGTINYFENTASLIDGSANNSHTVTVQTTDSSGNTYSEQVGIHFGTDATTGAAGMIDSTNYAQTGSGFTITAQNVVGGALTSASAGNVTNAYGDIGVNGTVSDSDSGDSTQIAYDKASGLSEKLIVDFDNDLTSANISFVNLHTSGFGEEGHWEAYDNGVLVAQGDFTEDGAGTGSGTITINPGVNFDQVVMSANIQTDNTDGSDYSISSINYTEAGLSADDTINGSAIDDVIYGFDGNDTLNGAGGDDVIYGGDETSTTSSGHLDLNDTGETDEYAQATNFQGFPSSAITVEMAFQAAPTTQNEFVLFSYAASGETNEFTLYQKADGDLQVHVGGSSATLNISTDLTDGNPHTVSVTWNDSTGSYQVYIDGSLEASTTIAQGLGGLYNNGTFIIGQEQDSVGGGFNSNQVFSGDVDFVRIFNDVRTSQEISDNHDTQFDNPGSESGLVTNWQFDSDSQSGTRVDDEVGSNDIYLVNTADIVEGATTGGGDTITGGDGNDILVGGLGADNLDGGDGNDTLIGDSEDGNTQLILNTSGGNDDVAMVSNVTDFPSSALTFEMRFTSDTVPSGAQSLSGAPLISYDVTTNGNDFLVFASQDTNEIVVAVDGNILYTGLALDDIFDGTEHMLSVSWDSATGGLNIYVDGTSAYSGTVATGATIASGGTITIGQEQDVVGGGFDSDQYFNGTIDEVRLFDDVRTAQEIADNAGSELSDPANEQGLVSNWQFETDSTTSVTDAAGSNDLTLSSGAAVGTPTGSYDDTLTGGAGDDTLIGGAGADSLDGGTGTDTVDYSTSGAGVNVNLDTGTGTGGDAQGDTYTSIEAVTASDHNDTVYGTDTGGVTVNLGAGNDTFDNDQGDATQTDTVYGGAGNDTIYTGDGNDTLYGGDGVDNLLGEGGDDTIYGGAGNDTLYGADGSDMFVFWEGHGTDTVYGGQGASWTDTIDLHDSSGGANLGTYGVDWTINLTEGSITNQDADSLTLSDDADGTITLQDGSSINFYDIERVEF